MVLGYPVGYDKREILSFLESVCKLNNLAHSKSQLKHLEFFEFHTHSLIIFLRKKSLTLLFFFLIFSLSLSIFSLAKVTAVFILSHNKCNISAMMVVTFIHLSLHACKNTVHIASKYLHILIILEIWHSKPNVKCLH